MSFFKNMLIYELCYPGAVTGQTEMYCPYCETELTVEVADPMGVDQFQCAQCEGLFEIDFGQGLIHYNLDDE